MPLRQKCLFHNYDENMTICLIQNKKQHEPKITFTIGKLVQKSLKKGRKKKQNITIHMFSPTRFFLNH